MNVRILGAHQGESNEIHFMSIAVDSSLAIDAGGLTSVLSLEEQQAIEAVLVTHQHYDHIKDLPGLAYELWLLKSLQLYCTEPTEKMLRTHLFNDKIWPSMQSREESYHPLIYKRVVEGETFTVSGYRVTAVAMSHTCPTVGYMVEQDSKSFFYTADTRRQENLLWGHLRPNLLIAETTMSSEYEEEADRFGHMTPLSLGSELRAFHDRQGYFPRTLCVHVNPRHEARVRKEIAQLAETLDAQIEVAHEGMVVEV